MKKVVISIILLCLLFSFRTIYTENHIELAMSPIMNVGQKYKRGLEIFYQSTSQLADDAASYAEGNLSEDELKQSVTDCRMDYKLIEHLYDYLEPEITSKYINGAPLPKVVPHIAELTIQDPCGLQALDEMIFLDADANKEEISKVARELKMILEKSYKFQKNKSLTYRVVIESIRYGILRVFALGITGFDTPGSSNAIPEAIVSMKSMKQDFNHFKTTMSGGRNYDLFLSIDKKISGAINYLSENNDFDSFDRLTFLKSYINPLYEDLYNFHVRMGIELPHEVDPTLSAHNYNSRRIFDLDFLNVSYFAQVAKSDLQDEKIIELGKTLFFDPILSKNIEMGCATCHDPYKGFTDGLAKSNTNKEGEFTFRNSPSLINSAYYGRYFWDMREYDLERQVKHVMADAHEFNINFIDLSERLKESKEYLKLFEDAYGDRDKYGISSWSISNSLAAYVASLSSWNSPFDKYVNGEIEEISPEVKEGFNLFMGKGACGTCHFVPSFSGIVPPFYQDSESEVLGVTIAFDTINPILDNDPGRIENRIASEEVPFFYRSFKTMTIRNAALSAPYMHNGSLSSLEEVMHFYNHGGGAGMGLEVPYQTLSDTHLGLSKTEMNSLISFVESLTDTVGMISFPEKFPKFESNSDWNNRIVSYKRKI